MTNNIIDWLSAHGLKIVAIIIVVFVINLVSKHLIEKAVRRFIRDNGIGADAEKKREDTLIQIFYGTTKIVFWVVAILMIVSEFGIDIAPLIAGAGVIGLAVGFGGQYLVKDVVTGLFIILENQYRVGDSVEVAGLDGTVEDITLRATVLRNLDGVVHHIPHGSVTTVSNKSMGVSKVNLDFGIAYESDIEKAIAMINRIGKEMSEDEYFSKLIIEQIAFLRVQALGDSAVVLKIVGVTKPGKQFEVAGELRKRLKIASDAEGISIPYPQMVVHQAK